MRRFIFTLLAFILTVSAIGQKKPYPWKHGGMFSLVAGQGGSRNWAAGADRFSFSMAASLNLWANSTWGKNSFENSADLSYAMINTSSLGVRKNDDKIDIYSKYGYKLTSKWNVGVLANLRTQFYNGFDYSQTPKRRTSGFFAPAYITLAPGFDYKPWDFFSIYFTPVASRWIIVTNRPYSFNYQGGIKPDGSQEVPLAKLYGVDPEKKVRYELGGFVSAKFNKDVCKNVNYKSRLDLLSNYLEHKPWNVDIYWTNSIGMKVNKWLQVSYSFDMIYDDDVKQFGPLKNKAAAQFRSMLGVGLATKF